MRALYSDLESIALGHPELYDTDVREHLAETLAYFFVWGHPLDREPLSYGMFSSAGDAAVAKSVSKFLRAAQSAAEREDLVVGASRHRVLQDRTIVTNSNRRYDHFIGHSAEPLRDSELPPYRYEATGADRGTDERSSGTRPSKRRQRPVSTSRRRHVTRKR